MKMKYNIVFIIMLFYFSSCNEKYYYYFSLEQFEKHGIRGYVKVTNNLIYPVTNYFPSEPIYLPEDAIFIAKGDKSIRIPIDSIKNYNSTAIQWPHKQQQQ